MDAGIMAILTNIGGRLVNYGFALLTAPKHNPVQERIQHLDQLIQTIPNGELVETPARATESPKEGLLPVTMTETSAEEKAATDIATACVACAIGHFSTSSGVLKEAVRFKGEGITSNEVLDRIAGALEEQNALEREDLSPEKIEALPGWEKPIAEEALEQSRRLRHKLENIQTIDELEQAAAETKRYYIKLLRQWYKGRFGRLGAEKAEAIVQRVGEG
jgi:hypothetical protein